MKNAKIVILTVAIVFVAFLVIQNTEEVVTKILFAEVRMPRAVLLIATFAIGFATGAVATLRFKRQQKPTPPST